MSSGIHIRASSQEITRPLITEIIWKIKYLKFHSNFPGANELIVEAEMSQKLSWRDLFVQIELGVDIASLGIK